MLGPLHIGRICLLALLISAGSFAAPKNELDPTEAAVIRLDERWKGKSGERWAALADTVNEVLDEYLTGKPVIEQTGSGTVYGAQDWNQIITRLGLGAFLGYATKVTPLDRNAGIAIHRIYSRLVRLPDMEFEITRLRARFLMKALDAILKTPAPGFDSQWILEVFIGETLYLPRFQHDDELRLRDYLTSLHAAFPLWPLLSPPESFLRRHVEGLFEAEWKRHFKKHGPHLPNFRKVILRAFKVLERFPPEESLKLVGSLLVRVETLLDEEMESIGSEELRQQVLASRAHDVDIQGTAFLTELRLFLLKTALGVMSKSASLKRQGLMMNHRILATSYERAALSKGCPIIIASFPTSDLEGEIIPPFLADFDTSGHP